MKKHLVVQDELDPEREEITEMMAVHFQNIFSVPPLVGKILAVIIMDGHDVGVTFEYLVERLGASKSSISTGLNMLLCTNKIYFYKLEGDRKKYFKNKSFTERFVRIYENIEFEEKIINRVLNYIRKQNSNGEKIKENIDNIIVYMKHLKDMREMTRKILSEFKFEK